MMYSTGTACRASALAGCVSSVGVAAGGTGGAPNWWRPAVQRCCCASTAARSNRMLAARAPMLAVEVAGWRSAALCLEPGAAQQALSCYPLSPLRAGDKAARRVCDRVGSSIERNLCVKMCRAGTPRLSRGYHWARDLPAGQKFQLGFPTGADGASVLPECTRQLYYLRQNNSLQAGCCLLAT